MRITHRSGSRVQVVTRFAVEHAKSIVTSLIVVSSVLVHVYYFNNLTVLEQQVTNTSARAETALQMRQNLVPALTMVVYQFINHEKNVFLSSVSSRAETFGASGGKAELAKLAEGLKGLTGAEFSPAALSRLMAVAENYPQLVSSESYQLLISRISEVEREIYAKRVEYNDSVNEYNTRLSTFPVNLVGRVMGFRLKAYFEWDKTSEWAFVTQGDGQGELPVSMEMHTPNPNAQPKDSEL